jgi:hypothetical protein
VRKRGMKKRKRKQKSIAEEEKKAKKSKENPKPWRPAEGLHRGAGGEKTSYCRG